MASDLIRMARVLERLAQDLRKEARSVDKSKGELARIRALSAEWPAQVGEQLDKGVDQETALLSVAVRHGVPVDTVAYHVRQAARDAESSAIDKRNREILRLARTGWTNKQLGEKFGLHHITISRIVRRALEA